MYAVYGELLRWVKEWFHNFQTQIGEIMFTKPKVLSRINYTFEFISTTLLI